MTNFEEYVFCKSRGMFICKDNLRPLLREQQLICLKATYSKSERFGSYPKSGNFNKLYKIICQVFWAKTSHTHSGDIRDLFYIL